MNLSSKLLSLLAIICLAFTVSSGAVQAEDAAHKESAHKEEMKEAVKEEITECPEYWDETVTDEDISYAEKKGSHSCRTKGGVKKLTLNQNVVGAKDCDRDQAKKNARFAVGSGHCSVECDGICGDDRECSKYGKERRIADVSCKKVALPGCNQDKGYECTAKPGKYRCKCACKG